MEGTFPYRVGRARRRAGGAGDRVGQRTVLLRVEYPRLLLLLLLCSRVLEGGDVEWWRRGHGGTREGWWPRLGRKGVNGVQGYVEEKGAYQQIVPVGVGAIGEPTRFFVFKFTPCSGIRGVGITAIGIVWRDVGSPPADIRSEELSRTIVELSAELENFLSEAGILVLELPDTVQRTHFIVREADSCLEPRDRLLELRGMEGQRMRSDGEIGSTCST